MASKFQVRLMHWICYIFSLRIKKKYWWPSWDLQQIHTVLHTLHEDLVMCLIFSLLRNSLKIFLFFMQSSLTHIESKMKLAIDGNTKLSSENESMHKRLTEMMQKYQQREKVMIWMLLLSTSAYLYCLPISWWILLRRCIRNSALYGHILPVP